MSEELHGYLDPKLKPNENWSDVFEAVYAKTHKGCLKKKGGSCALNVYINTNVIITANVGDSRAILVTSTGVEVLIRSLSLQIIILLIFFRTSLAIVNGSQADRRGREEARGGERWQCRI